MAPPAGAPRPDAAPSWEVLGSSVRGASHLRSGAPNQDALLLHPPDDAGQPTIVAVADGHGSAPHFRSGTGAAFAVQAARAAVRTLLQASPAEPPDDLRDRVAAELLRSWRAAVSEDLAARPITQEEWRRLETAAGPATRERVAAAPLLAYGSTVLAVGALGARLAALQLGDGDILRVEPDGSTSWLLPRDERLGGNATTSLCQVDAERELRTVVLDPDRQPPAMVLLSSDGYANSFADDRGFLAIGADYLALLREWGCDAVSGHLATFLDDASHQGSGDDVTLALLVRADLPVSRPAPSGGAGRAAGDRPASRPRGPGARRRLALLGVILLGLALAALGLRAAVHRLHAVDPHRPAPAAAPARAPAAGPARAPLVTPARTPAAAPHGGPARSATPSGHTPAKGTSGHAPDAQPAQRPSHAASRRDLRRRRPAG